MVCFVIDYLPHKLTIQVLDTYLANFQLNIQEKEARKAIWSRYQKPKSSWMRRNPILFQVLGLTVGLSIFFSRPLFEIFFTPGYNALEKPEKK